MEPVTIDIVQLQTKVVEYNQPQPRFLSYEKLIKCLERDLDLKREALQGKIKRATEFIESKRFNALVITVDTLFFLAIVGGCVYPTYLRLLSDQEDYLEDHERKKNALNLTLVIGFSEFIGVLACTAFCQCIQIKSTAFIIKKMINRNHASEVAKINGLLSELKLFDQSSHVKFRLFGKKIINLTLSVETKQNLFNSLNFRELLKLRSDLSPEKFDSSVLPYLDENLKNCLSFLLYSNSQEQILAGVFQLEAQVYQDPSLWCELVRIFRTQWKKNEELKKILISLGEKLIMHESQRNKIDRKLSELKGEIDDQVIGICIKSKGIKDKYLSIKRSLLYQYDYFKALNRFKKGEIGYLDSPEESKSLLAEETDEIVVIQLEKNELKAFLSLIDLLKHKKLTLNHDLAEELLILSNRWGIEDSLQLCYSYLHTHHRNYEPCHILNVLFKHANSSENRRSKNKDLLKDYLVESVIDDDYTQMEALLLIAQENDHLDLCSDIYNELKKKEYLKLDFVFQLVKKYPQGSVNLLGPLMKLYILRSNILASILQFSHEQKILEAMLEFDSILMKENQSILLGPDHIALIFRYPLKKSQNRAKKLILDKLTDQVETIQFLKLTEGTKIYEEIEQRYGTIINIKIFQDLWVFAHQNNRNYLKESCFNFLSSISQSDVSNHDRLFQLILKYPHSKAHEILEKILLEAIDTNIENIGFLIITHGTSIYPSIEKRYSEVINEKNFKRIWDYAVEVNSTLLKDSCKQFLLQINEPNSLITQWPLGSLPQELLQVLKNRR